MIQIRITTALLLYCSLFLCAAPTVNGWVVSVAVPSSRSARSVVRGSIIARSFAVGVSVDRTKKPLFSSSTTDVENSNKAAANTEKRKDNEVYDYTVPEDAVVHIKPAAMRRLRELRTQQQQQLSNDSDSASPYMVLRMGVRSGGCSGMSYVMDFVDATSVAAADGDDQVDTYESDKIQCVVDAKSMLYLYGLELDYSTELIGGGFRFFNPNAEESCGCGSSFGV
jgi:iron-sulfur cluster assembly accessory protein